jgi:predicted PurR-regulated permease PerM
MRASEPETAADAPVEEPPPPEERAEAPHDPDPLGSPSPEPPARVAPVMVPRWIQLVVLPLALLGAWAILRAAGPVLLLFIVAGLIALLLNPFVTLLRRARFPRGAAVGTVFLVLVLALSGLGLLLANPVADQVSSFRDSVPGIVDDANASLADVQDWLDGNGIDVQVSRPGQTAVESLGDRIAEGSGEIAAFTRDALVRLVEGSIAVILIVVLSVYMLLYGERIGAVVRGIVPPGDGSPEDDFPTRIQGAVFGYVRGQLLFSLIMGTSAGVVLWVLGSLGVFPQGKTYAVAFGAWYGFAELIPYVGPAIGAFPPVLIALFSGEPLDALWLVIAFTALQQIEGHIVAPTVFSQALRINPLLVIFALLLGGQLYGFLGAFIALPIAATLRETAVYLRRHVRLEPWDLPAVAPAGPSFAPESTPAEAQPEPAQAEEPREPGARCPECGAPRSPDADVCPQCGTELGEADEAASAAASAPQ